MFLTIGRFIQSQILKMEWLNELVSYFLKFIGLNLNSKWEMALHFFIYDVIKIGILLCILIFIISYIQSYFPPKRSKRLLSNFKGIWANIFAALLGTVTPFCSCSSIPIFIGFTSAGLPIGVTFSFLISSPMVDLGSLILLMSIFGAKVALAYTLLGLIIAVIGGLIIEKSGLENQIEDFILNAPKVNETKETQISQAQRFLYAKYQVVETFKKVFPYILVGVGIGATIHNWIPKVAFVCVHNSCRSQIAEALAKKYGSDVIEAFSAGTELKDRINQDALRLIKEIYAIDMEETQKPKLIDEIPRVDYLITMGCNVSCPFLTYKYEKDDWGSR